MSPRLFTTETTESTEARYAAQLTVALNSLNRSMGLDDAYPFVISPGVRDKLALVHRAIRSTAAGHRAREVRG